VFRGIEKCDDGNRKLELERKEGRGDREELDSQRKNERDKGKVIDIKGREMKQRKCEGRKRV
jgi:hypothetical protein